jgi:hypothetical protein
MSGQGSLWHFVTVPARSSVRQRAEFLLSPSTKHDWGLLLVANLAQEHASPRDWGRPITGSPMADRIPAPVASLAGDSVDGWATVLSRSRARL